METRRQKSSFVPPRARAVLGQSSTDLPPLGAAPLPAPTAAARAAVRRPSPSACPTPRSAAARPTPSGPGSLCGAAVSLRRRGAGTVSCAQQLASVPALASAWRQQARRLSWARLPKHAQTVPAFLAFRSGARAAAARAGNCARTRVQRLQRRACHSHRNRCQSTGACGVEFRCVACWAGSQRAAGAESRSGAAAATRHTSHKKARGQSSAAQSLRTTRLAELQR